MAEPPQVLRIKRKRGQDPLQALILEDSQRPKRSKQNSPVSSKILTPNSEAKSWYFQLSGTDDTASVPDPEVLASVLSEAVSSREKRQFVIPKNQTEEDTVIPNELAEMLDSFLNVDETKSAKRKRRGMRNSDPDPVSAGNSCDVNAEAQNHEGRTLNDQLPENQVQESPVLDHKSPDSEGPNASEQVDDYVFDVYRLSSTVPLTNNNYPSSQIGYIRFFDDDEYELMQSDDENKSRTQLYSDDEDSNAESFYQNDYPEDEDAGTYSDTYEPFSQDDDDENDENIGPIIIDNAENAEGHAYLQGHVQADQIEDRQFDDLYDEFFDEDGENRVDFLQQDDDYAEEPFERQHFFEGEEDDAMAIHRDRIFGKLQRMIDERE